MRKIVVGKRIPEFSAPATGNRMVTPNDLRGRPFVLYFYPRDDTPGCTLEAHGFRDAHARFKRSGITVLGVSRDTLLSHEKFKAKHALPFGLIADPHETLCDSFGVMKDKNMYGKKVRGIERSTFLFDAGGVLRKEWRKVAVDGHVEEVLAAARELAGNTRTPMDV